MEEIKAILVAVDLEVGSDVVVARAEQLASAHAAKLVVLHVIEPRTLSDMAAQMKTDDDDLRDRLKRQAIDAFKLLIAKSDRLQTTEVKTEFGLPREVITHVAREMRADVVLVGPGQERTLKDRFLGSTAERVIRTSTVPTLVVKGPSTEKYRSVAIAVDGSPQSKKALIEACRLAPDGAFRMVHAVDVPLPFQQTMLRAGTTQEEMAQYRMALASKVREELAGFQLDMLDSPEIPFDVLDGNPGSTLVRYTRTTRVDLLALGAHGRGATLQALLGSVTRHVIGNVSCDVLVANIA